MNREQKGKPVSSVKSGGETCLDFASVSSCDQRTKECQICGTVGERCKNPGLLELVSNTEYFSEVMEKHKRQGNILHWFSVLVAFRQNSKL